MEIAVEFVADRAREMAVGGIGPFGLRSLRMQPGVPILTPTTKNSGDPRRTSAVANSCF